MRIFWGLPISEQDAKRLITCAKQHYTKLARSTHWTDLKNFHLTVKFLGETSPEKLDTVVANVGNNIKKFKPFTLSLSGISAFPTPYSKVIAALANLHSKLDELYNLVDDSIAESDLILNEDLVFSPHITLCRRVESDHHVLTPILLDDFNIAVNELICYEVKRNSQRSDYIPIHRFNLV